MTLLATRNLFLSFHALTMPCKERGSRPPAGRKNWGTFRMTPGFRPVAKRTGVVQPVVVIATINAKGKVEEAETPPNSDPGLSEAALSLVKRTTYAHSGSEGVPHQRLTYINVKFVPWG